MAFDSQNNTVLVSDMAANVVRIMNPSFTNTVGTITLPDNAQARGIAVNDAGTLAAVAMRGLNSVALIDPNVPVIDTTTKTVSHTVSVGHDPGGIAVDTGNNRTIMANMQSGSISTCSG